MRFRHFVAGEACGTAAKRRKQGKRTRRRRFAMHPEGMTEISRWSPQAHPRKRRKHVIASRRDASGQRTANDLASLRDAHGFLVTAPGGGAALTAG